MGIFEKWPGVVFATLALVPLLGQAENIPEWLQRQGVQDVPKTIKRFPNILTYSPNNLDPKVAWLRSQGVLNPGKVIEDFPQAMSHSIEESFGPKAAWLKQQGVENIGKVIQKFPQILGLSISENLDPKAAWLKKLGATHPEEVIEKNPQFLGCSLEDNLNPKVNWLKKKGFQNVGLIIERFPPILDLSVQKNLAPKIHHLQTEWGLSIQDIESKPMILSAKLARIQELADYASRIGFDLKALPLVKKQNAIIAVAAEDLASQAEQVEAAIQKYPARPGHHKPDLQKFIRYLEGTDQSHLLLRKGALSPLCNKVLSEFLN